MVTFSRAFSCAVLVSTSVLFVTGVGWANPFAPSKPLELSAQGGVFFSVPAWKESQPPRPDVAVMERDERGKGGNDFFLLMLTIEPGPQGAGKIDWNGIRNNIVNEAKARNATVALTVGDVFSSAPGFEGRRMKGTLKTKGAPLALELVALVQKGKLVTVSVVSGKPAATAVKLLDDVAKTAALKAP